MLNLQAMYNFSISNGHWCL